MLESNAFMSNYSYPKPLLSKLTINSNLESKYPFINLTYDMLQKHNELFTDNTSFNLLYLMNINTNYSKSTILEMFKSMMYNNESESNCESLMYLMSYYLMLIHHKKVSINVLEPSMKSLIDALNRFINNPQVSYHGSTYSLLELTPLGYNINGDNVVNIVPFYGFLMSFYTYGRPYKFYDEIGSESIPNQLYANIEVYCNEFYKKLATDLQLKIVNNTSDEWYKVLKEHNQLTTYSNMLSTMLGVSNVTRLRDQEMNKQIDLLNQCYEDQSVLSSTFLEDSYKSSIDDIIETMIDNCPITHSLFSKFPVFSPMDMDICNYHSNELNNVLECCLTGSTEYFIIDNVSKAAMKFNRFSSSKSSLETGISPLTTSYKRPFTSIDVITKAYIQYIRSRLDELASNMIFDAESNETPIKLDFSDFNESLIEDLNELYLYPSLQDTYNTSKYLIDYEYELKPEVYKRFKSTKLYYDLVNINKLSKITMKIYPERINVGVCLTPFLLEACCKGILKESCNDLTKVNVMKTVMKTVMDPSNESIDKIHNILLSDVYVHNSILVKYVNEYVSDFNTILSNSNNHIYLPYITGNRDNADLYSIGGIKLYNEFLDINPFNRGYSFISDLYGTSIELETLMRHLRDFNDVSLIDLVNSSSNENTIMDTVMNFLKKNINTNEYYIDDNSLTIEHKPEYSYINGDDNRRLLMSLLENSYEQIKGDYVSDVFKSISLIRDSNGKYQVNSLSTSSMDSMKVSITDEYTDSYMIPVYKYVASIEDKYLTFVNEPGYKLYTYICTDTSGKPNQTIFVFTTSTINVFNTNRSIDNSNRFNTSTLTQ